MIPMTQQTIDLGEISISVVETDKRQIYWLRMADGEGMECSVEKIRELLLEFYRNNF